MGRTLARGTGARDEDRLHRYYAPLRQSAAPSRPAQLLAERQLAVRTAAPSVPPCCTIVLFRVCHAIVPPAESMGAVAHFPARRLPSSNFSRVGFRTSLFEACSTFTIESTQRQTATLLESISPMQGPMISQDSRIEGSPRY